VGSGGATTSVVAPRTSRPAPPRTAQRPDAGAAPKLPPALWEAAAVIAEILLDQRRRALVMGDDDTALPSAEDRAL
jgi:hypothetical protein